MRLARALRQRADGADAARRRFALELAAAVDADQLALQPVTLRPALNGVRAYRELLRNMRDELMGITLAQDVQAQQTEGTP